MTIAERVIQTVIIALGLFNMAAILALTTVYIRRVYAKHVVPMGLSAATLLAVIVMHGNFSMTEQVALAAALLTKCVGLWAIFSRIQDRK